MLTFEAVVPERGTEGKATLVIETGSPIPFTVADAQGIEKGALLKLVDRMVASGATLENAPVAGIAAAEKIASNGKVKLAVFREGIFKMTSAAAITIGQAVALSATANKVKTADATCAGAGIVGIALEAAGGADETILVRVNAGCVNNEAYS